MRRVLPVRIVRLVALILVLVVLVRVGPTIIMVNCLNSPWEPSMRRQNYTCWPIRHRTLSIPGPFCDTESMSGNAGNNHRLRRSHLFPRWYPRPRPRGMWPPPSHRPSHRVSPVSWCQRRRLWWLPLLVRSRHRHSRRRISNLFQPNTTNERQREREQRYWRFLV